ncbi:aftiphilin a isoform X2 [Pungitius pungitius]|uniref:aftiphilin a isoform X2 n=1 Tax=Pungitius pungitius TaxID=134920 RepID=UPI002E0DC686
MEPDVIRMYSSSPPPMEDGADEDDNEFGDFGTFSSVPNSVSFTEFDTPTTFNQSRALSATSPPEILHARGGARFSHGSSNGPRDDLSKANGVVPAGRLGGGVPPGRTEMKKVPSGLPGGVTASGGESADCNGGGTEVLTNGFATSDVQGSPPLHNSVPSHTKGMSTEDTGIVPEDDFADFAAFSNAEGHLSPGAGEDSDNPARRDEHCDTEQASEDNVRDNVRDNVKDAHRTGANSSGCDSLSDHAEAPGGSCNTDRGPEDEGRGPEDEGRGPEDEDRGPEDEGRVSPADAGSPRGDAASEPVCTPRPPPPDGDDPEGDLSPDCEAGESDGKCSGNETETETETSLGRPLSTDALEEFGDMSTTGSVPSPPLQGESATPADHSQEEGEEGEGGEEDDFGDFGDSFGGQGFDQPLDFGRPAVRCGSNSPDAAAQETTNDEDDFGDFNSPKFHASVKDAEGGAEFADFPASDSFGNFNSAADGADGEAGAGWSAFGEQQHPQVEEQQQEEEEEESWAAFSEDQSVAPPAERRVEGGEEEEEEEEEWHESELQAVSEETSRTGRHPATLSSRLEKLFQGSFPRTAAPPPVEDEVASLRILLGPPQDKPQPGAEEEQQQEEEEEEEETLPGNRSARRGVWMQLQDVHEAVGLRYQWGGSYCNKALLCCLGIDTRNILFTGQKKQPVIVPMYAASLGMLEPTKEPVKPVSAAEMIASIAQAPPVAPETSSCLSDAVQEALPPVQFDWSSSGLTNPLDASGGSSLLNLDFFGPVEDSGSSSSPSIPGVDPELYELTTAKMDSGGSGSRVADAFARLMSTMEKTSTSTRKPRKEENLSEEAAKVIARLPDLSFMQAKVLMFPATLTPLSCQATAD